MRPRPFSAGCPLCGDPGGALLTIWDRGEGMAVATETAELSPPELSPKESFAALLDESLGVANGLEGTVVKCRVISIENDAALIDVGLQSGVRVALKDFGSPVS